MRVKGEKKVTHEVEYPDTLSEIEAAERYRQEFGIDPEIVNGSGFYGRCQCGCNEPIIGLSNLMQVGMFGEVYRKDHVTIGKPEPTEPEPLDAAAERRLAEVASMPKPSPCPVCLGAAVTTPSSGGGVYCNACGAVLMPVPVNGDHCGEASCVAEAL